MQLSGGAAHLLLLMIMTSDAAFKSSDIYISTVYFCLLTLSRLQSQAWQ